MLIMFRSNEFCIVCLKTLYTIVLKIVRWLSQLTPSLAGMNMLLRPKILTNSCVYGLLTMGPGYQMGSKSGFSKPFTVSTHKVVGLDWRLAEELLKLIRVASGSSLP